MRVARLGPGDAECLAALNALYAEVFEDEDSYTAHAPDARWLAGWLAQSHHIAVCAWQGDRLVGGLSGYRLDKFEQARSEIYIYDLGVIVDCRRQGVATALIEELRRIARAEGVWTIFVQADIVPEDEPARRLYRKLASEEITALHFDIAP